MLVNRIGLATLVAALLALAPAAGRAAKPIDVALVVHKSNPVSGVSSSELRRILLGDQTRWAGNGKITILLMPPGSEDRTIFLRVLLQMSDDDFVRHWISRVFQGEATSGPKTASSPASMVKLVAGLPSAVGVMNMADLPSGDVGLKILRVDGKSPGEDGYRLRR